MKFAHTTSKKRISHILLFALLIFGGGLFGQKAKIKGVVTDEIGSPVGDVQVSLGSFYTMTKDDGSYELNLIAGEGLVIIFAKYGYEPDTARVSIKKAKVKELNMQLNLMTDLLVEVDVVDKKARFENQVRIDKKYLDAYAGPGSKVEGILKMLPGVSSYNELSSQYSVRGGNFDENLVYINGIEVYRSFLVRNGQQEGLSIVNSQMVSNVKFSAGGFEARYGDKMASVLDIVYKKPEEFGIKAEASLMGGSLTLENSSKNKRISSLIGARYRNNQLVLNSFDTDADFRPQYADIQAYLTYDLTDEIEFSFLGNYSRNVYEVVPSTRITDFGTFEEPLRLTIYFDGKEDYDITTRFGAFNTKYKPSDELTMDFSASVFQTTEQEYFDVLGAYSLGDLNSDLGSDDFGEVSFTRSTGGFQNYARNFLDIIVSNIDHRGTFDKDEVTWRWGAKVQREDIIDRYKEWERIDSAGYSIPAQNAISYDEIIATAVDDEGNIIAGDLVVSAPLDGSTELFESYESDVAIVSTRIMAYLERTEIVELKNGKGDIFYNVGLRTNYWTFNKQNVISPRAAISYKPNWEEKDMVFRLSGGFYYQPPFYREMRDLEGGVNENIQAQQSIHVVLGNDYQLKIWDRPFKMVTELYYKHYNDLIPYDLDNVRIRYRAENSATGFATGLDYRINGEFVKGVESWASLSVMTIQEDIEGDDAGYLARPTDQRVNFKIFFQDYLPQDPTFKVSLTLTYGTGLPFGPPQGTPEERVFRLPDYRRVDIGFSKVLKTEGRNDYKFGLLNSFKNLSISLEVFNLLDTRNTISYLWVRDVSTSTQYAVPNYLTGRLLNLKLTAGF